MCKAQVEVALARLFSGDAGTLFLPVRPLFSPPFSVFFFFKFGVLLFFFFFFVNLMK